jgi:hypothetical protein
MYTLAKRVRVAIALGEPVQAERDAHHALAIATDIAAHLVTAGRFGSASPRWHVTPAVTPRPPDCSAQHLPFASASAWSVSRLTSRITKPPWRNYVMPWTTRTLRAQGREALRCPPTRRSPTRSAVTVNANAPLVGGRRSPGLSAMSCDSSAKDWPNRHLPW